MKTKADKAAIRAENDAWVAREVARMASGEPRLLGTLGIYKEGFTPPPGPNVRNEGIGELYHLYELPPGNVRHWFAVNMADGTRTPLSPERHAEIEAMNRQGWLSLEEGEAVERPVAAERIEHPHRWDELDILGRINDAMIEAIDAVGDTKTVEANDDAAELARRSAMTYSERFELRLTPDDRRRLRDLATVVHRSEGDTLRMLVRMLVRIVEPAQMGPGGSLPSADDLIAALDNRVPSKSTTPP